MRDVDRVDRLERPDGCEIAVRLRSPNVTRSLVMSNGLGCGDGMLGYLIDDLATDHAVITWDYRGHGSSTSPKAPGGLTLGAHVSDLGAVQSAAGVAAAVHLGYGFGVTAALEHYRRAPSSVQALVLIQGAPSPEATGIPSPAEAWRTLLLGASALGPVAARVVTAAGLGRAAADAAVSLGIVGPSCDRADLEAHIGYLAEQVRPESHLDVAGGLAAGVRMGADVLAFVEVPTLVFGADRDAICPEAAMRRVHERIRGSEYVRLASASRACPIELGPVMAARIRRFLKERLGWQPVGSARGSRANPG